MATAEGAWSASVAKAILPSGKVTRVPGRPETPDDGRAEVQKRCFLNCVNGALTGVLPVVLPALVPKTLRKSTGEPEIGRASCRERAMKADTDSSGERS